MPPKGLDCVAFVAYALGDDERLHPIDLSQTVTLSADMADGDDKTNYGLVWDAGDPYHYALVSEQTFAATMSGRYGRRWMMKWSLPPRGFRRWVRHQEKERRKRLKEVSGDD